MLREDQSWRNEGLSHEQLVTGIRGYLNRTQESLLRAQNNVPPEKRQRLNPAEIIRKKLDWQSGSTNPQEGEFFDTLRYAWDAVTYDTYKKGTWEEGLIGSTLQMYHSHHKGQGEANPAMIELNDPIQVRLMDALTEAADIPYKKGQTEITIPGKLCNYTRYKLSPEYQAQLKPEQRIN